MPNFPLSETIDLRKTAQTIKWAGFANAIGKNQVERLNFQLVWAETQPSWLKFMDQTALTTGLQVYLKLGKVDNDTFDQSILLFTFKNNKDFKRYAGVDGVIDSDLAAAKNNVLSARITLTKFNNNKPISLSSAVGGNEIWFVINEDMSAFGIDILCEAQGPTNYN